MLRSYFLDQKHEGHISDESDIDALVLLEDNVDDYSSKDIFNMAYTIENWIIK